MTRVADPRIIAVDADADGVRVLRVPLDDAAAWTREALLTAAERARASRYLRPADGLRFAAARQVLRDVLGRELGVPPDRVDLRVDEGGRPFVPGGPDVNLSHCEDTVLIALAPHGLRVGIDVERLDRDVDTASIAGRLLARREAAVMAGLDAATCREAVLRTWVWKEAYAKLTGEGIRLDLRSVERDETGMIERSGVWTTARVTSLAVGRAHAAALAWAPEPASGR